MVETKDESTKRLNWCYLSYWYFLDSTTFRGKDENTKKKIVRFLVQIKTLKFTFEIYWPLETVEKNSGKRSSKHNFARGILDEVAHVCRVAKASRQQQLLCNHVPRWVELISQVSFWLSNSENLIPYCSLIKRNLR